MILPKEFYDRPVIEVAHDLVGKVLHGRGSAGIIIETEAYHQSDKASHSYSGLSKRNADLFKGPGYGYVYFIYGTHWCFNTVCEEKGIGAGVLIRALIPISGIEIMKQRRGQTKLENLCSGPGKITQALDIRPQDSGCKLYSKDADIHLTGNPKFTDIVATGKRIGISKDMDLLWRFGVPKSPYLSRPL